MKINKSKETHFGLTFLATGRETNGKSFLSKTTVPSGDSGPPMHAHSKEDEGFYLKKGALTFIVEGKEIELKEGQYLNIEKGEEHTWKNESEADAKLIVTFVPAGIENMFIELEKNMGNMKEIGQKYGTEFQLGE
jgi:quercetin dioxygenase-like cupin family protein